MASKVDICNMALSRLGANTITSLTDNTPEAKLCNTLFDNLARRVTVQGSWTTAVTRATLARTTNTPEFKYAYEFQLPNNCLKVLNVNEEIPYTEYEIEDDKLLSDDTSIKIRYIKEIADSEDYGVNLTEVIEILLASYLAMPITGDKTLAANLRQEYAIVLANNLAVDNQQGFKQSVIASDLTEVRDL